LIYVYRSMITILIEICDICVHMCTHTSISIVIIGICVLLVNVYC